jgi:uncharacterized protein (DUF433 family)
MQTARVEAMVAAIVNDDVRLTAGLYDIGEAARLVNLPQATFRRWAMGYESGAPLLHMLPDRDARRESSVPFIALAEAWVLNGLRRAGVRPNKIRPGLEELKRQFGGSEYVLMAPELATDGVDLLWDFSRTQAGSGMIEARTGQHVFREIIVDYLKYLTMGSGNLPESLRLQVAMPSNVVVDPHRMFGQPIFVNSGARMADIANMIKAGEDTDTVAFEHGVTVEDVRTAARVLLGHAA